MTDGEPTKEQLTTLLEIQELDTSIRQIEHKLGHLPEQVALDEALDEASGVRRQHEDLRVLLDQAQAAVRQHEREVGVYQERLAAEQQRMYSGDITNPRELQALRAEITTIEGKISDLETAELEALEEVDSLDGQAAELDTKLSTLGARVDEFEAARDEAAKEYLASKAEAEVKRDALREGLPADLLDRYDTYAEKFNGNGLARLDDDMCTGCRIDLPRVDVNELLDGPPLATCPECRRLLVVGA